MTMSNLFSVSVTSPVSVGRQTAWGPENEFARYGIRKSTKFSARDCTVAVRLESDESVPYAMPTRLAARCTPYTAAAVTPGHGGEDVATFPPIYLAAFTALRRGC